MVSAEPEIESSQDPPHDSQLKAFDTQDTDESTLISSDDSSDEDGIDDSHIANDKILKRSMATLNSASKKHQSGVDTSISLQRFDLGLHYDPQITRSIERLNSLKEESDKLPSKVLSEPSTSASERKIIRSILKKSDVSSHYIDLLVRETISRKFVDWHFITENSTFEGDTLDSHLATDSANPGRDSRTLEEVLRLFGVANNTTIALFDGKKPLSTMRQYDTLCELTPIGVMMNELIRFKDGSDSFLKYFFCFILDRKVYDSFECDALWCSQIAKLFPEADAIHEYSLLVESSDYFIHYRLSRLIPSLQSPLIKSLFYRSDENYDCSESIWSEFHKLLDSGSYQSLLYFILFVYGSKYVPYGATKMARYFEKQINELSNKKSYDVEVALLKSVLNLFIKI